MVSHSITLPFFQNLLSNYFRGIRVLIQWSVPGHKEESGESRNTYREKVVGMEQVKKT